MKSGLGAYAVQAGDLKIGAIIAANPFGAIIDRRSGSVIRQKLWLALAPSIAALSYSSWGMVVSPVDSRIVLNGIPIQTFAIMTTSMAVFELVSQSIFCEIRCTDRRI